ncbi:hypothetical protein JMJ77_0004364 [Colletotrichum scovillei]|uniref:Uncharacterized protein n=1 Tax=Colletotrichum scovillei TaxID=1209932 RepID=A0A9P7U8Z1_9PEZI|nr:hypothetical protein JMJ77_0004364 [Colletotrichum scovillei]KAG7064358.1 hypothetical protein JMJ76_0007403 [Colletotrichum scovillei]
MPNYSCSQIPEPLEAYGDITGLGVVLAFTIAAWSTILILIAYYLFGFDPSLNPYRKMTDQGEEIIPIAKRIPNPADQMIYKHTKRLRGWFGHHADEASGVEQAFHKCILTLADTQLVTGLSIMLSGYYALTQGLSAYHWQMVLCLAWFSTMTHLSALTFLRTYLNNHPAGRFWRIFLMSLLATTLTIGFIPTGHFTFIDRYTFSSWLSPDTPDRIDLGTMIYPDDCDNFKTSTPKDLHCWLSRSKDFHHGSSPCVTFGLNTCTVDGKPVNQSTHTDQEVTLNFRTERDGKHKSGSPGVLPESPAICFFRGGMITRSESYFSLVVSLALLTYGYTIRVFKLFEKIPETFSWLGEERLDHRYQALLRALKRRLSVKPPSKAVLIASLCVPLQASLYHTLCILLQLYTSMIAEVFSISISAIWGTLKISSTRDMGNPEDNDWAFGQVISLVLLSSPLTQLFEVAYKTASPWNSRRHTPPSIRISRPDTPGSTPSSSVEMLTSSNTSRPSGPLASDRIRHIGSQSNGANNQTSEISQSDQQEAESNAVPPRFNPTFTFRGQNDLDQVESAQSYLTAQLIITQLLNEAHFDRKEIWNDSLLFVIAAPIFSIFASFFINIYTLENAAFIGFENYIAKVLITAAFLPLQIQMYIFFIFHVHRFEFEKGIKWRRITGATMSVLSSSMISGYLNHHFGTMMACVAIAALCGLQLMTMLVTTSLRMWSLRSRQVRHH